jgi:tetratricopeptide (TPR) repeat protein
MGVEGLMQAPALFNPFPGLRPFEPDEDYLFFGREKEIDELLGRLKSSRFLSVVGTSGSGKSSLVRCGLIPALQSGSMARAGSSWRVSVVRPGADPLRNLATSLNGSDVLGTNGDLDKASQVLLEVTLRRSSLGLIDAFRQAQIPPHENLLVVIDQFEELFRFRQGCQNQNLEDEAVAFVKLLLEATQQDELPIYVVLTMRSDFIGDCMEYSGLPEAVNAGMYLVPRMTRDELRSAITGPVAVGGGQIAPRLVLRLLNDVGDDQDRLPILQHALMRTWDYWQQGGRITEPIDIAEYEAIGTLRHALSRHAEEAYLETGSEKNQRTTERMFRALTDTYSDPRGVRRPTSIRELAAICEALEPEVIQIVEIFRQRGRCFLMPPVPVLLDSRSIIDISHESLMRCWDRLIAWADEERRSADCYMRLSKASAWFEEGTAGLWRDPELEFGLQWWVENDPNQAWAERYDGSFMNVLEFLDLSKKERERAAVAREKERKKMLRWTQGVASVFLILFAVAGYSAYVARKESARVEMTVKVASKTVGGVLSAANPEAAPMDADVLDMDAFRKDLLKQAQDYYQEFELLEPNNVNLREGMAQSHSKLGDIYRLGKHPIAESEYKVAITEYSGLAKDYPANPDYREALGYAYNFLGETLRLQEGSALDAENAYQNALEVQKVLAHESPANSKYQQELARTYNNRGILRDATKQFDDSKSDFGEAIKLLEPLAKMPSDPSQPQELARVYNNLGALLKEKKQVQEAEINFKQAIAIDEELVRKVPDNREYKLELAEYYDNFATLLFSENQIDMAKQYNLLTLNLMEELAAPVPSLRIALAKVHNIRARILDVQDPKEALSNCQESLEILQELKRRDSRNIPELQLMFRDLGYNYVELAERNWKIGSLANARKALNNLSNLLPELSDSDRTDLGKEYHGLQELMARSK